MTSYTETTTDAEDKVGEGDPKARYWVKQLMLADDEAKCWLGQAKDAYAEYIYAKSAGAGFKADVSRNQHVPFFWANIEVLSPTIYGQPPEIIVKRLFDEDDDEIGRVAAMGLGRIAKSLKKRSRLDKVLRKVTNDYLIAGLGCPRVYYEAKEGKPNKVYLQDGEQIPEGVELLEDDSGVYYEEEPEIVAESVTVAWVPYETMRRTPGARDWSEVTWVSFDIYMQKKEFEARFGEKLADWKTKIPFTHSVKREPTNESGRETEKPKEAGNFARITEIWNMQTRTVCWVSRDYGLELLDESEDIYDLVGFFPIPEPAQGTTGDEYQYPVPDFIQYRQVLATLDFIANRIRRLIKALRARGVYDASQPELARLAREADEADLVGVENYMAFLEKGGLENLIQYAPVERLAQALVQCYQAFDFQKGLLYEISGLSDIVRGATAASETLGAQQLKAQYANVRVRQKTDELARIGRDLVELQCDLALSRLSDDTLNSLAGVRSMTKEDQQLWPQALQLLRSDKFRTFIIEVETDSTIKPNIEAEYKMRVEHLRAMNEHFKMLIELGGTAPELVDAATAVSMSSIRGLRQSTALEGRISAATRQYIERLKQPKQEAPDPELLLKEQANKLKAEAAHEKNQIIAQLGEAKNQIAAMSVRLEQAARENDIATKHEKNLIDKMKNEADAKVTLLEIATERKKSEDQIEITKLRGVVDILKEQMKIRASERESDKARWSEALSVLTEKMNAIESGDEGGEEESASPQLSPTTVHVDVSKKGRRSYKMARDEMGNYSAVAEDSE